MNFSPGYPDLTRLDQQRPFSPSVPLYPPSLVHVCRQISFSDFPFSTSSKSKRTSSTVKPPLPPFLNATRQRLRAFEDETLASRLQPNAPLPLPKSPSAVRSLILLRLSLPAACCPLLLLHHHRQPVRQDSLNPATLCLRIAWCLLLPIKAC